MGTPACHRPAEEKRFTLPPSGGIHPSMPLMPATLSSAFRLLDSTPPVAIYFVLPPSSRRLRFSVTPSQQKARGAHCFCFVPVSSKAPPHFLLISLLANTIPARHQHRVAFHLLTRLRLEFPPSLAVQSLWHCSWFCSCRVGGAESPHLKRPSYISSARRPFS